MAVFDTFAIVGDITDGRVATACWRSAASCSPPSATATWYASSPRRAPPIPMPEGVPTLCGLHGGLVSLLDYMFMPMIGILLAKIYLTAMFPGVEPWIFIFGLVTVMTFLNLRGIKLVANFNGVIVFIQIAIIVTFLGLIAWG